MMGSALSISVVAKTESQPIINEPLIIDDKIRNAEYDIDLNTLMDSEEAIETAQSNVGLPETHIIDAKVWMTLDDYTGYYIFDLFYLYNFSFGENTEIWIQANRSWLDPDPQGREYPVITQDQVEQLLGEFESNILPTDSEYFGEPDTHDGNNALLEEWGYMPEGYYNSSDKNVILVSNIMDANYYTDYPYYIAGFYSPTFEAYFDRNIISIDCYDWENRVGPDGSKPYTYESTIAHEYQHLIHDDYNREDPTYMNEGCSMFAEIICGYPTPWNYINTYLATPDNSLTLWEDQGPINILADYGASLLYATYLNDQYSNATDQFLSYFVKSGQPGKEGINSALNYFGYEDDFEDTYHNWRIANLIHTDCPGNGKYNYETIDLGYADEIRTYDITGSSVPPVLGTDFGNTTTILGYDTGISMLSTFGSDYYGLTDLNNFDIFTFDGDDEAYIEHTWTKDPGYWYSGTGDLVDSLIAGEVYVDPEDPTLTIETIWDLEQFWDFGFVQVSEDGNWESEWTSLADNEGYSTTIHDPSAHPKVKKYIPGLTGFNPNMTTLTYDLSAYSGETIYIGFRLITDWAYHNYGWEIHSVDVSGNSVDLDYVYPPAEFMVTLVRERSLPNGKTYYDIDDVYVFDECNFGIEGMFSTKWDDYNLIVSPTCDLGYVDYEFAVWSFNLRRGRFCK